jgi:hypothetical protein|tara:strand:+ start:64333 stop:64866 length:534 start_codon:yes stop_codon:yes gene_type:complete
MKSIYIIIGCALAFLSCATSKNSIETNKSTEYNRQIEKVFIVSYKVDETEKTMKAVSEVIVNSLKMKNIDSELYYKEFDDLELSPELPKEKIDSFQPDVIMFIALKSGMYNSYGLTELNLDLAIVDLEMQKVVWKADVSSKLKARFGFQGLENKETMKKLGDSIVQKMIEDELLNIK